jgi:hypothetical protein
LPQKQAANVCSFFVDRNDDDGRRASIGGSLKKNDATHEFETRPLFAKLFADPFFFWTAFYSHGRKPSTHSAINGKYLQRGE